MKKIEEVVLFKLNDQWKKGKVDLTNDYYIPLQGSHSQFKNPDPKIETSVWKRCVEHWESKEYMALQEINKKNASVPRMHHTTGTQSFAQVEHNHEKKTGNKFDRVTKLEIVYTRRDGSFISGQAKKAEATSLSLSDWTGARYKIVNLSLLKHAYLRVKELLIDHTVMDCNGCKLLALLLNFFENIVAELSTLPHDIQNTIEGRNRAFHHVLGNKDGHGRVFLYGGGVRSIDVSPKRKKWKLAT